MFDFNRFVTMLKTELIQHIECILLEKIEETTKDISSLRESRNNDTKSSAGDKYETGREMIQIELNKLESLLEKTKQTLHDLLKINTTLKHQTVELGSLILSEKERYFISVPVGKVYLHNVEYYAISLGSPLAMALRGKKKGDKVIFQQREIVIKEIQ